MRALLALSIIISGIHAFIYTQSLRFTPNIGAIQMRAGADEVVVVGGGFGGLYTALKMASGNNSLQVTLVDPKDKFVFLPLLYELAVGTASVIEVAPRYADILEGSGVTFRQASVTDIDVNEKTLTLDGRNGGSISFDQLVVSVGSQPRSDMIPGSAEYAMPFSRVEDAYELKRRLRALLASDASSVRVAVVGGGYSGAEVAASVAEYLGQDRASVTIIDRNARIMSTSPSHNREAAEQRLAALGVRLEVNTAVAEVRPGGLVLQPIRGNVDANDDEEGDDHGGDAPKGEVTPADLVILTAGIKPNALTSLLIQQGEFMAAGNGRLAVDRTLRCQGQTSLVWALGDCACVVQPEDGADSSSIPVSDVPLTAQAAMQQADIVAANAVLAAEYLMSDDDVEDQLSPTTGKLGSQWKRFTFVPLGEMLTLGLADASISSLGGRVQLDGPVAALARRLVYAARMPTDRQRATALAAGALQGGFSFLQRVLGRDKR